MGLIDLKTCHKFKNLKFNLLLGLYPKKKKKKNLLSMVSKIKLFNKIEKRKVQEF